jgi:nanoRNase/pAp phosphatase (c-di-AMP/oligoRNAs hydrolase)
MTQASFVESCVETVADSAQEIARRAKRRPRAKKLLKLLDGKKNVLVTTHMHPDPDALAAAMAMTVLLKAKLKDASVTTSVKGQVAGGINRNFAELSKVSLSPWDQGKLKEYDAIVLLDTQPPFAFSPLPPEITASAVVDHHRPQGRKPSCGFCDVRTDVGATTSIVFSYFMELEVPITAALAASMLYAIESDLAGSAGTPGELDNMALANLTLLADTRLVYRMRYVRLPQSYFEVYATGLANAVYFDHALISHLDEIDTLEKPAVLADSLLRFDKVDWVLVTAVHDSKLVLSLRTTGGKLTAADMIKRLLKGAGTGGGHRRKAGGSIPLETGSPTEIERRRMILRRRYLRALGINTSKPSRLVSRDRA